MRLALKAAIAAIALLGPAGCGGAPANEPGATVAAGSLEGDAALIEQAQKISDAIGGCERPAGVVVESKVVGLESGSIVMLGCSQGAYTTTHRLFAARGADGLELLSLPDYDAGGWIATDQAAMAELDAGTGVMTTFNKAAGHGGCGSEGNYQWDGARFQLQELRWKACSASDMAAPPFPILWPTQQGAATDANSATPAP